MSDITFETFTEADLPQLETWLHRPHVRQWWGEPASELAAIREDLESDRFKGFIVHVEGLPVGFVQWWRSHDGAETGIDLFIAEKTRTGRGLGTRIISAMTKRLFSEGAVRVTVDPNKDNAAAIAAFAAAGYEAVEPDDGRKEPYLLMVCDADKFEEHGKKLVETLA
ncbi:MAG: GNAT family N-acetyltransferase [Pikeienuella sp.]